MRDRPIFVSIAPHQYVTRTDSYEAMNVTVLLNIMKIVDITFTEKACTILTERERYSVSPEHGELVAQYLSYHMYY